MHHPVGVQETLAGFFRRGIRQQVIERGPQGVDIAAGVGVAGIAAVLLERGVKGRAAPLHDRDRGVIGRQDLDQAEVDQLDHVIGGQFEVARLDIPVQDRRFLAVQKDQSIGDLFGPRQHLTLRQELLALAGFDHQSAQVFAGDVVHHQKIAFVLSKNIGDLRQVGMVEAGEHVGLALELLAGLVLGVRRQRGVQPDLFDGAQAAFQAQIVGLVDAAHPAAADKPLDAVAFFEDISGFQCSHNVFSIFVYTNNTSKFELVLYT